MAQAESAKEKMIKGAFSALPFVGIVVLLVGLGRAIDEQRFDAASTTMILLGHLFFLALFLKKEMVNLKYYLNVTVFAVAVVGIAVMAYLFAMQYTKRIDLSSQKFFSLSDETIKYLKDMSENVSITVMLPDAQKNLLDDVIQRYKDVTGKVDWTVMDPNKDPLKARTFGAMVNPGDIFVKSAAGTSKKISVNDMGQGLLLAENVFTNAIVDVTRTNRPKVYFLTGHREIPFAQPTPMMGGMSQPAGGPSVQVFRKMLEERAYQTAELNLTATANKMPEDCAVLVIAGPTNDLFGPEAAAIGRYLAGKGKLLLLMPAIPQGRIVEPYTNIKALLKPYGIELPDKLVVDLVGKQLTGNPAAPLGQTFDPTCPVTSDLASAGLLIWFLPPTRPVVVTKSPPGLVGWELIQSSRNSWPQDLVTVLAGTSVPMPPQSEMQPQPLAAAVGDQTPRQVPGVSPPKTPDATRLVVFGDDELIEDNRMNRDATSIQLMLNSVKWLSRQENTIAVPRREIAGTPILLDKSQLMLIFIVAVLLIPEALFFGGLSYSFLRRRR